jgi:hypothetical protein
VTLIKWGKAIGRVTTGTFESIEFKIYRDVESYYMEMTDSRRVTLIGWRLERREAKERCEEVARDIQAKHGSKK